MKKNLRKQILIINGIIFLAVLVFAHFYVNNYYHADISARMALELNENVSKNLKIEKTTNCYAFIPENPVAGFIFYPGGKVEFESYAPLLLKLAEKNILCVVPKMPKNLAVLDNKAADGLQKKYPQVEDWYIGGHSLGGSMAAVYVSKHVKEYKGLILLAAYSIDDLRESNLKVLSVFGSEDKVLKKESYEKNRILLPQDFTEIVIPGGCHAYFGNYGFQSGDGIPTISPDTQQELTVEAIMDFVKK